FRRAGRVDWAMLPRLFQEDCSSGRDDDLGSARPIHIFAGVGRALSGARRDARAHAAGGVSRGFLDSVHVWSSGAVSGSQERLTAEVAEKIKVLNHRGHRGHRGMQVVPWIPLRLGGELVSLERISKRLEIRFLNHPFVVAAEK